MSILNCCYKLPEYSGVYYFYDNNDVLLYIGKSINIRQRVLSHFYNKNISTRHQEMMKQVATVKHTCTAGELGALFLESAEIKRLYPIYNRRLRQLKNLYSWVLDSEKKPKLLLIDEVTDNQISMGLYSSKHRANESLKNFVIDNQLCLKVIGLEKTTRSCFNFQLKQCLGACCGKEPLLKHDERLVKAFNDKAIISWPYKGSIAIEEENPDLNLKQYHIVNQWRYMTTIENIGKVIDSPLPPFSRDAYKILISFLKNNNSQIIEL